MESRAQRDKSLFDASPSLTGLAHLTKVYLKVNLKYMENIVGLKELRQNIDKYIAEVKKGKSLIVFRRSKPLFRLVPPEKEEDWEEVVDFTKIRKGGVSLKELLSRL